MSIKDYNSAGQSGFALQSASCLSAGMEKEERGEKGQECIKAFQKLI